MASSNIGLSMHVVSGLLKPKRITLEDEGEYVIGRLPDSDIQLEHKSVSGEHALLKYDGKKWTLKDLKSHNGTILNRQPLGTTEAELPEEGHLRLGGVELNFRLLAASELTSPVEQSGNSASDNAQVAVKAKETADQSPSAAPATEAVPLSAAAPTGQPATVSATSGGSERPNSSTAEPQTLPQVRRRPSTKSIRLTPDPEPPAASGPSILPAHSPSSASSASSLPSAQDSLGNDPRKNSPKTGSPALVGSTPTLPPPIPISQVESLMGSSPPDDSPPTLPAPHNQALAMKARHNQAVGGMGRSIPASQDNAPSLTLPSPKRTDAARAKAQRGREQEGAGKQQPSLGAPPQSKPVAPTAADTLDPFATISRAPGTGQRNPNISDSELLHQNQALNQVLDQARRQLNQLLSEGASSRREIDVLRQENARRSQDFGALQASLKAVRKELAATTEELNAIRSRETQALHWFETSRRHRAAVESENEALKRFIEGVRAENMSKQQELERLLRENSSLRSEMARVQSTVAMPQPGTALASGGIPEGKAPESEGPRQDYEALVQRNQALQKALLELRESRGTGITGSTAAAVFDEGTAFSERLENVLETLARSLEDTSNLPESRAILQKATEQVSSFRTWLEEGKVRKG